MELWTHIATNVPLKETTKPLQVVWSRDSGAGEVLPRFIGKRFNGSNSIELLCKRLAKAPSLYVLLGIVRTAQHDRQKRFKKRQTGF